MDYINERIHRIPNLYVYDLEHRLSVFFGKYMSECRKLHCLYFERENDIFMYDPCSISRGKVEFRISYMDMDNDRIMLEKKTSISGMSSISSCVITRSLVETILGGHYSNIVSDSMGRTGDDLDPLIQEFYWEVIGKGLRPRMVVDYDSKNYRYRQGSAEVSINTAPRVSYSLDDFLTPYHVSFPVNVDKAIVHVKWMNRIPEIITSAFSLTGYNVNTYSAIV